MRHSQRGVTFLGWVILLVPMAIVVYAGIRLTPIYLNYMRVARSVEDLTSESKLGNGPTDEASMRLVLNRHFEIEGIDHPTVKDIEIHRDGEHWVASVDYEDVAPLFGNMSLLVQFHKEVDVP
jgi:uncharacterized protein DUF4845